MFENNKEGKVLEGEQYPYFLNEKVQSSLNSTHALCVCVCE